MGPGHAGVDEAREHVAAPADLFSCGQDDVQDGQDGDRGGPAAQARGRYAQPDQARGPGDAVDGQPYGYGKDQRLQHGVASPAPLEAERDVREALAQREARDHRCSGRHEHERADEREPLDDAVPAAFQVGGDDDRLYRRREQDNYGEVDD
jgi:hypothetical protein